MFWTFLVVEKLFLKLQISCTSPWYILISNHGAGLMGVVLQGCLKNGYLLVSQFIKKNIFLYVEVNLGRNLQKIINNPKESDIYNFDQIEVKVKLYLPQRSLISL